MTSATKAVTITITISAMLIAFLVWTFIRNDVHAKKSHFLVVKEVATESYSNHTKIYPIYWKLKDTTGEYMYIDHDKISDTTKDGDTVILDILISHNLFSDDSTFQIAK